jgi:tetratricopeptide (TPR) repeat protein
MVSYLRRPFVAGWFIALFLCAATILAYRPALNGGFIWDDDAYVTKNSLLTAPDGLRRIWFSLESPSQYFPLTYTAFRIERAVWGLNPSGYHWVNLLLHLANAFLVWRLLARLRIPGAWLAASIFALHPVQVESVAWITELKNVLMGFFFLLTLLAWVEYIDISIGRRWLFYFAALFFYLLALCAKTTACTLPAALILILWLREMPIQWRRLVEILPFLLLGIGMGLIAVWWERYHQGTRGALFALNPLERLLIASRATWFYLGKLLWPANLIFIYPQWKVNIRDALAYSWLLGSAALALAILLGRNRMGRGVEVGVLFFIATLSPLLGFIMLYTFRYTFVADHYQYLAAIGPIALISTGIARLLGPVSYTRLAMGLVSVVILGPLWLLTWGQSSTYRDIETLWRTTIVRNHDCWMAYNNLGIALFRKGEIEPAISQYEKSLELHPDYAQAHYNLGNALLEKGEIDQAIAHCLEALRLEPNDSDEHVALGNALMAKEDVDGAITHYQTALTLYPDDVNAHYNLANALLWKGNVADAIHHLEKAVALQPTLTDAHINLGNIFSKQADAREAIFHYEEALKISPRLPVAQTNLAWVLASCADLSLRDGARAIELAESANRSFDGKNTIVLHTLAAAYAQNGQFDKAVETAQGALKLALDQNQGALADDLRREIRLYQARHPYMER